MYVNKFILGDFNLLLKELYSILILVFLLKVITLIHEFLNLALDLFECRHVLGEMLNTVIQEHLDNISVLMYNRTSSHVINVLNIKLLKVITIDIRFLDTEFKIEIPYVNPLFQPVLKCDIVPTQALSRYRLPLILVLCINRLLFFCYAVIQVLVYITS